MDPGLQVAEPQPAGSVKRRLSLKGPALPVAASKASEKLDPWELYGVSPPGKRRVKARSSTAVIASSDEEEVVEEDGVASPKLVELEWFDQEKCVMKRIYKSGQSMVANCFAGENGFLVYQFEGEEAIKETEIPLVALDVLKKPSTAAVAKKKSAAVLRKPAASAASASGAAEVSAPPSAADQDPSPVELGAAAAASSEPPLHNIRITQASKPERTYIQGCQCDGTSHRMQLLVQYTLLRDGVDHHAKALKAKAYMEEHQLNFGQARQIRSLLPQ